MRKSKVNIEKIEKYIVINRLSGRVVRKAEVSREYAHKANENFKLMDSPDRYVSAAKWFYSLQEVAEARFEKIYKGCERQCVFQIVEPDRVIEQWQVFIDTENPNERVKDVLVSMIEGSDTLLMYEMKFIASN